MARAMSITSPGACFIVYDERTARPVYDACVSVGGEISGPRASRMAQDEARQDRTAKKSAAKKPKKKRGKK